jgi:hypothetical protein
MASSVDVDSPYGMGSMNMKHFEMLKLMRKRTLLHLEPTQDCFAN